MNWIRRKLFLASLCTITLVVMPNNQAHAIIPILKIIQEAIKKVIKAVDLMIQRMQNETIALQNAAKVLENKLSKLKLQEIADWSERQRKLYEEYYDELWRVRNTIGAYKRIKQIILKQKRIADEYSFTWRMINQDKHFSQNEIDYMYLVYTGILNESLKNIDQLLLIVNSYQTQMTDAKRLEIINSAGDQIDQNYSDLREFNNQNIRLSINRAKDANEIETIKKLYGLQTK